MCIRDRIEIVKINSSASYTYNKLLTGKKICLKNFWPFLTPNYRGQPLLFGITRKVLSFQTSFVIQVFRNSWSFLRYLRKNFLGADPITPYRGHLAKKLKIGFCWDHETKQLLFHNAFQNVCRFRDIRGHRFAVLAPKIPYYVTYDINFDMMRLRLSRSTVPLLTLITNY